jgi:hypothetical protein
MAHTTKLCPRRQLLAAADLEQYDLCSISIRGLMTELHRHLLEIVQRLPSDFEPYGCRSRDDDWGPDCSCGCKYFLPLEGSLGMDWGVCANPASPRASLLTFEHQGCQSFEADGHSSEQSITRY